MREGKSSRGRNRDLGEGKMAQKEQVKIWWRRKEVIEIVARISV